MAREGISYDDVAKVCEYLASGGTKPNQRNIRAELGTGSIATILKHLNEWKAKQSEPSLDIELPPIVLNTIKKAVSDAVTVNTEQLKTQLDDAKKQLLEDIALIEESEQIAKDVKIELHEYRLKTNEKELELEKNLAASNKQVEDLQAQIKALEVKLNDSLIGQEIARTEAAKAQMQVERADKATNQAESQVLSLQTELSTISNELINAEKEAATTKAVNVELNKAIERLDKELSTEKDSINKLQSRYEELQNRYDLAAKHEAVASEQVKQIKRLESEIIAYNNRYELLQSKLEKTIISESALQAKQQIINDDNKVKGKK